jgi:hypothetical protein
MRYEEIRTSGILEQAFKTYKQTHIVKSQTAFSVNILGMKPSYYSCMASRRRRPPHRVLITLRDVTKTIMATFLGNPHFGKDYAVNLNSAYHELELLLDMINVELSLPFAVEDMG